MQSLFHHVLLVCLCLSRIAITAHIPSKYELMSELVKYYPEDGKYTVPTRNLRVFVSVTIYCVFGLDEDEVLKINGWAKVQWNDPRLRWNPIPRNNRRDYNRHEQPIWSVYISRSDIWVPDVGIINAKEWENKDFANSKDKWAEVDHLGNVTFYAYFMSETPCSINTKAFPFDAQVCPVTVGTTHSKLSDFSINSAFIRWFSYRNSRVSVSQWKIVRAYFSGRADMASNRPSDQFQTLTFHLVLKRKPIYHIVLAIVPYCLICLVGSLIFVIKSPGERFGLSLTILLAMSVYVMIVSQGAPKSMTTLSAMDNFLLVQMSLQVVFTFVMVLGPILNCANRYSNEKEEDRKRRYRRVTSRCWTAARERMPRWNRKCDFGWLLVFLTASAVNGSVCLFVIPKST